MAAIRVRILDSNDNTAVYAQLPVSFRTEGELELVGPGIAAAEGGMTGTYVRTTGRAGSGTLTVEVQGLEPVIVRFNVS